MLVLDSEGAERARNEGYLSKGEFRAWLEMALARVAFTHKRWAEAQERYALVAASYPDSAWAPEAVYWRAVSQYKATNDHTALGELPGQFKERYPDSVWALKTAAWAH